MHKRHILLALALAVTLWLAIFGDKTPDSVIAEPVTRPRLSGGVSTQPNATSPKKLSKDEPVILALHDRENLIGGAKAEKVAEGIFKSHSWMPPPPPPPKPLPPPPPMAPPLPFVYLGKKFEDAEWEVYLGRGEQTFIVRQKTMIEGVYRADSIEPPTLTLTYMPLNQQQLLTIGGSD